MEKEQMKKGARKIVELCAGVKPGERVLIVTDTGIEYSIAQALYEAALACGGDAAVMLARPGEKPGEEPAPLTAAAMRAADVILSPTTRTIFHSQAATQALKAGARLLSLTEISEKILVSGGIDADFKALQPRISWLREKFQKGGRARITAKNGTDITLDMTGRDAFACTGLCHEKGQRMGIPELEVFIAPIEGTSNGTLVIDACISGIGGVKDPVVITLKDGRLFAIKGGGEAERLLALLDASGDPACRVIAEFALGLNDKARVIGDIIEDEGVYGTGHFAFGNNVHFGGANPAPIHLDMVYWHPTVEIDGQLVMRDGRLVGEPAECLTAAPEEELAAGGGGQASL